MSIPVTKFYQNVFSFSEMKQAATPMQGLKRLYMPSLRVYVWLR